VNQAELRRMTEERLKDARALLKGKRWEFAYYSAGYAVECALKSCLLVRMVVTGWVFDEANKKVEACRTHDFSDLIDIAGMRDELNRKLQASALARDDFVANWRTVNQWRVASRYEAKTEAEARELLAAITDKPDGVLEWIRNYW
jgi:HEPN domain-containing protein